MKILSKNIYIHQCECETTFTYDESDIHKDVEYKDLKNKNGETEKEFINCPLCNKKILPERKLFKKVTPKRKLENLYKYTIKPTFKPK